MNNTINSKPVETTKVIVCIGLALVVGATLTQLPPIYIGLLVEMFAPTLMGDIPAAINQATSLLGAELLIMALASIPSFFWMPRLSWRKVVTISSLMVIICGIWSIAIGNNYELLMWARGISGFFMGNLMTVAIAAMGSTQNKSRNIGNTVAVMLAFSALVIFLKPYFANFGPAYIYGVMTLLGSAAFIGSFNFPHTFLDQKEKGGGSAAFSKNLKPIFGLIGSGAFMAGNVGIWALMERFAHAQGLSGSAIASILTVAVLFGIMGAILVGWAAKNFGMKKLMLIAASGQILVLTLLIINTSLISFAVAACVFFFFWNLWFPHQIGLVAQTDKSGRYIALLSFFQGGSAGLGPVIAGRFIVGDDFSGAIMVSIVLIAISISAFMITLWLPDTNDTPLKKSTIDELIN